MSAGFSIGDRVFWGTNGAVGAYVEVMAALAAERLGADTPLAAFFREERDGFYMGKVVFLDEWVVDVGDRRKLLDLLDAATAQLLHSGAFSDYGRTWVATVITELCAFIAVNA